MVVDSREANEKIGGTRADLLSLNSATPLNNPVTLNQLLNLSEALCPWLYDGHNQVILRITLVKCFERCLTLSKSSITVSPLRRHGAFHIGRGSLLSFQFSALSRHNRTVKGNACKGMLLVEQWHGE